MMIIDQAQRQQALDIGQSFIVQAPAGSGKTTLLTQRFLRLLTIVDNPEEITAITFTKKAATEMRNRILNALERAAYQPAPVEEQALLTWQLAEAALEQSAKKSWDLLQNPARLRVQTIDSLAASLITQMPLLAQLGAPAEIEDDPLYLYEQAADNLLASLEDSAAWTPALADLLLHLDNNYDAVKNLLVTMLMCREQWLPHIINNRAAHNLRQVLENNLKNVIDDTIIQVKQALPAFAHSALLNLGNFSRQNLQLPVWEYFPPDNVEDWQYLANCLLTNTYTWRKQIIVHQGFPTEGASKEQKIINKQRKQEMMELIKSLQPDESLRQVLQTILQLPPAFYEEHQWKIVDCLLTILPILVAQLQLVFKQAGKIDFIALNKAALQALGEPDNPTDLGLRLDYKIQHLLIDEFQDTSTLQFHFFERLTAGWEPDDGRTLFLVGDPMQSIYRFRAAEVGLFLRAQQRGIGNIPLIPLQLQTNFRSTDTIVSWLNTCFTEIFPAQQDIATGAVAFNPAVAVHASAGNSGVSGYLHNSSAETDTITQIIQQANPQDSIAILVQTRTQLKTILPVLQQANIPYQAVEIEKLAHQPYIRDLVALANALYHLADRLAWLSVLRAPWCALSLADLLLVSQHPAQRTIWDNINDATLVASLSATSQTQLTAFRTIMRKILAERGRMSFANWVYAAWLQLHGPACIDETDTLNVNIFFELLADLTAYNSFSPEILEQKLAKLYARPQDSQAKVQVMTIHKAKGLEFDTVILPGLEKLKRHDQSKLLLWFERPRADGSEDLLLAPIKSKMETEDAIYEYLRLQHNLKAQYEAARLLYVAATRARHQLHLLASVVLPEAEEFSPPKNSFLAMLWSVCKELFVIPDAQAVATTQREQSTLRRLDYATSPCHTLDFI